MGTMAESREVLLGPSMPALEQLVFKLTTAIERSVGASTLGAMLSRLLLVLHYAGQGSSDAPRLPGDMRDMALGVALVAARRLREASDDAALGVAAADSVSNNIMALALEDQRAEQIDELCRLGFIAAALAEQRRDAAARNDKALARAGWVDLQVGGGGGGGDGDGGGWTGDDEDDESPLEQQILNVVLAACEAAASG